MNLKIKIPNFCLNEQKYILDILLKEFLGINFVVETFEGNFIEITRSDYFVETSNLTKLTLDASFFYKAKQDWLQPQSMPVLPLVTWAPAHDGIKANLVLPNVPVLYGSPGLVNNGNHIHLNLDIFGSAFFMLSRYEEVITKDRDGHGRFPAYLSHAYKNNYLHRPLVDEYVEILKKCIIMLWPDLKFKERK